MKPDGPLSESPVHTAVGEDANRLRSLRTAFVNGEFGRSDLYLPIPIEQPDGSRFNLFVRDVVEFETADAEPSVPWADLGQPIAAIP